MCDEFLIARGGTMQAQIRLGRIFGIEIGLHYSWLIIAVLIATSLAGHFSEAYPDWAATIIWTTQYDRFAFFRRDHRS